MSVNASGYIVPIKDSVVAQIPGATTTTSLAALGTLTFAAADIAPTVYQLLAGYLKFAGAPGGGLNIDLPTASAIQAAIPSCQIGAYFDVFCQNGCGQTITITSADANLTLVGTVAIPTSKCATLRFIITDNAALNKTITCAIISSA